jgi:hypothetical protein
MVKNGCPTDSLESVVVWKTSTARRHRTTNEQAARVAAVMNGQPPPPPRSHVKRKRAKTELKPKQKAPPPAEPPPLIPEPQVVVPRHYDAGDPRDDFDDEMVRQAEQVCSMAYDIYVRACDTGNPAAISAALKNWSDAGKNASALRKDFLELRAKSRQLVPLDEVLADVSEEVLFWRRAFLTLGERLAGRVPPEAAKLITEESDRVLANMSRAADRARGLFAEPEPEAEEDE